MILRLEEELENLGIDLIVGGRVGEGKVGGRNVGKELEGCVNSCEGFRFFF